MKQLEGFTAKNYDPQKWVKWIKKSGAKYAVITTKHHDGVALWDTKQSDLNVIKKTKAGRDLIEPFVKAMRDEGLHLDFIILYSIGRIPIIHSSPAQPNAMKPTACVGKILCVLTTLNLMK